MNIEELRDYCMSKDDVTESFPFDSETLVFKVQNKMFALAGINNRPLSINLKCNPEKAIELREQYECVKPGYHMNKQHWNTVIIDGSVNKKIIKEWIDDSYQLIVTSILRRRKIMDSIF